MEERKKEMVSQEENSLLVKWIMAMEMEILWLPQSTFSSGHSSFICNLVDGGNNNNNTININITRENKWIEMLLFLGLTFTKEWVKGSLGLAHVFGTMLFGVQWYCAMVLHVRNSL